MMAPVVEINFKDPTEGIPAFMAILMMPFAYSTANVIVYSIADGIVYGVLSYVILKVVTRRLKEISSVTWLLFIVFILKFLLEGGLKIVLKIK